MKVIQEINKGIDAVIQEGVRREAEKLGIFRAGNAGAYNKDTHEFFATCPRKTILRHKGLQFDTDRGLYIILQAGMGHELNLLTCFYNNPDVKTITVFDKSSFLKEFESKVVLSEPLSLKLSDEVTVSGRPDFIIEMNNGYKFGIEAKATTSEDKSTNSLSAPFLNAVCQASLYKKMTGIDYFIIYGSYSTYSEFKFFGKKGREYEKEFGLEYREFPTGYLRRVPPKLSTYGVSIEGDCISIIREEDNKIIDTNISFEMITDYYLVLNEYLKLNEMPDRKQEIELYGKPKYSDCKYCVLKDVCDAYDNNAITFDRFLRETEVMIKNERRKNGI